MTKPRILIVENSIDVTGSLHAVLRTARSLKESYDFVFVLPKASKAIYPVLRDGFHVYEVSMLELSKSWRSFLLYIPKLVQSTYRIRKIISREKISIVHVNDFYNMIMPLYKLSGGSIRYLNYVNFVPNRFPFLLRKIWIRNHLLFSDRIIAVSQYVLKQLPVHEKVICIPDALPDQSGPFVTSHARRKLFLFIGNFINGKGQDLAIRAFGSLAAKYPEWKLRFVGGDMGLKKNKEYKTSLKSLAEQLHVEKKIEWGDFSTEVKKEYQDAAIALNFSISESFSLTVQEAMFYGCAVIATDSGGPAELIDHEFSGLLVPLNNIPAMTRLMEDLIVDEDKRFKLALNAEKSVRKKFSRAKTIDLLDNVYRCMVK